MKAAAAKGAIHSMTGFAQALVEEDGWSLRIDLRSVNHRFLDLHLHLPAGFEIFEPRLRQAIRRHVRRGHVDVNLHYEAAGPARISVNRELAAAYMKSIDDLRSQFNMTVEPNPIGLLQLPGVIAAAPGPGLRQSAEAQERLARLMDACLEAALMRLATMRRSEGAAVAAEMHDVLTAISEKVASVESLTRHMPEIFARNLELKLAELLHRTPVDPGRVAQEAAILAQRSDVSEELSRLRSHLGQFEKLLDGAGETGKKLDFLLQEMQREANTLLSKSPGTGSDGAAITGMALEIKSDVEKLREQVQNVE